LSLAGDYTGLWKLLYDWQTLLAGAAAIFGGWLAYRAGVKQATATGDAAAIQIQAIATQTAALEQQNAQLRRADQRRLARESLIAARMLDASLEVVANDIGTARSSFGAEPRDGQIDEPTANSVRHAVGKPGFAYLWEKLGILDREIAVPFLTLEAAIERMRAERGATIAFGLTDRLDQLSMLVERLRDLAGGEIGRATRVLSADEQTP
jgi:hypothetical protein